MRRAEAEAELRKHHAVGFGWALACCAWDREEAEEVLQTACLKVLDGRARFSGRSSFRTWLLGVIRLTAAERRRRRSVRLGALARLFASRVEPERGDPEQSAALSRRAARLVAALGALPRRQREVVHLVFYGDLSVREAAQVMGVSAGTASRHYERAKARLRETLGDEEAS